MSKKWKDIRRKKKTRGLDLWTMDNLLHVGGGIGVALMWWLLKMPPWQAVMIVLVLGFGREVYQHLDRPFPWVNFHNVGEALSWGVGACMIWVVRCVV